jgi:hypothetical protein
MVFFKYNYSVFLQVIFFKVVVYSGVKRSKNFKSILAKVGWYYS